MSITVNVITARKKDLAQLIKACADFLAGTPNERVNCQFDLELKPEDEDTE